MSEIFDYLESVVQSYLEREIDVDKFREVFAGSYQYVRNQKSPDKDASNLLGKIVPYVAEFSGGYRMEESLRKELEAAIRPFGRVRTTAVMRLRLSPRDTGTGHKVRPMIDRDEPFRIPVGSIRRQVVEYQQVG